MQFLREGSSRRHRNDSRITERLIQRKEIGMAWYVKVPLAPDGIVNLKNPMRITELRAEASEVVTGDAFFLMGKAAEEWPEYCWKCEGLTSGKYVITGEAKYPKV
jgi:hypothetical protein